ncbi:hypothetical protein [Cupriavidus metallidurans]|uniref:hypothetical protein n=1 Tax=Cupriavidus metallidurans TaxID=119219 RepID=UPI0035C787D4
MNIEGLSADVISTLGKAVDQVEDLQCVVAAAADIQKLPEAARAEQAIRLVCALAARATEVDGTASARTALDAVRRQQRALRRRR